MATLLVNLPPSEAALPERGAVIGGRYEIERRVGRGGYGQVFAARHLGTGQKVALKILRPPPDTDEDFAIKRFFLEARVTSGLQHANTVRVFDFGQEDSGLVYLAMELLSGLTLRQEIKKRKEAGRVFTEMEAVDLAIQVTRSLGEAHAAGLVHRDLKPDNIFLHQVADDDDPMVKVLDFGIVKLDTGQHTLSSTTSVPGTPAYMSPEHALNLAVDGRADLYSLGVILYQLVTGELPFRGPSDPQTLYAHAYQPLPNLRDETITEISAFFQQIIERSLAKQPDDRFETAKRMREALTQCTGGVITPSQIHPITGPQLKPVVVESPMATNAATGALVPTAPVPRRTERIALLAGVVALILSVSMILQNYLSRDSSSPDEAATPSAAAPDAPDSGSAPRSKTVSRDAGMRPDAGMIDATTEVPEKAEPKKTRKKKRKKKKKKKRKTSNPEKKKKKLIEMRLEELVDQPKPGGSPQK